jgi:two-component system sensor kinase FixL
LTARNNREAALQAREAQLESILRTVPSAMVVIDETGIIEIASPSAEALFGYSGAEMVGRNVSMLMPQSHSVQHDDYLTAYLTSGERKVIGQTRLMTARHADGHEIPIELRVGEARFGDRRLFTGFLRDQTERLATEERMGELRADLAHVSRLNAMGEMAAGLAHELNQPLAASTNYLAAAELLIRKGAQADEVADMLKSAARETLRAGEIIRRLRDFVERREVDVRITLVEDALREAVSLTLVGKEQFETRLEFMLDPAAKYMMADRIQVQQVVVNLLRNAIEAMRDRPRKDWKILVGSRLAEQAMVEIYVEDAGSGIDVDMMKRLGHLFATTKGEEGLGLGLAICKRIVEAHGGNLWAENRTQEGAIFHFTIPCARGEEGSYGVPEHICS